MGHAAEVKSRRVRQHASVAAEMMLGHPRVIEAELFDLDDLFEHAAVETRQLSVELGHVSGQYMRAEFHRVAVVFPKTELIEATTQRVSFAS